MAVLLTVPSQPFAAFSLPSAHLSGPMRASSSATCDSEPPQALADALCNTGYQTTIRSGNAPLPKVQALSGDAALPLALRWIHIDRASIACYGPWLSDDDCARELGRRVAAKEWGPWTSSRGKIFELGPVHKKLYKKGVPFYRAQLVASDGTRILMYPRARKTPQLYVTVAAKLCYHGGHSGIQERVERLYGELGFTCCRSILSAIDLRRDIIWAITQDELSVLAGSCRAKPTHYHNWVKVYGHVALRQ